MTRFYNRVRPRGINLFVPSPPSSNNGVARRKPDTVVASDYRGPVTMEEEADEDGGRPTYYTILLSFF